MKKINWGVMGTARIAKSCVIPGMMKASNCNLYAIAGRKSDKVECYKNEFGFEKGYCSYDELLDDPCVEAAYIPLTNNLHREWVIKALNHGKHVLCEKPMALNAEDAKEMYAAAEKNKVLLMEAFAYLHGAYMKSLTKDIKSGIIGDVIYVDTAFVTQGYDEDFRLHKELGGGMIYDLGCYCTSMILSFIDSDLDYARAVCEKNNEGVDIYDSAIVRFKNGARASFDVGMILGNDKNSRYDRLFIHGSKGDIRSEAEYNGCGNLTYRIIIDGAETVKTIPVQDNYSCEISEFGDCIINNTEAFPNKEFCLKNATLIDKLLENIDY